MSSPKFALLGLQLALAAYCLPADQIQLPTRRDAFMHVQYTTTPEFVAGLKKHPKALKGMARVFHVSNQEVLDFISSNLHLDTLKETKKFKVWGLTPGGKLYTSSHTFKKGMKVWALSDGTPVIRFVCSNPMVDKLPAVEVAPKPEPAPAPVPAPAPAPAPEMKPEPAPAPAPMPEMKPEPKPAPAPAPAPEMKPEPAPAPTPAPEMKPEAKPVLREYHAKARPQISLWGSAFQWNNHNVAHQKGQNRHFTYVPGAGISADLWNKQGLIVGPYLDTVGYFSTGDNRPLRYAGFGLQVRKELSLKGSLTPYVGLGYGAYRINANDDVLRRFWAGGGRAFAGLQTSSKFYAELAYNYLDGRHNFRTLDRFSGILGYRF